MRLLRRTSMTVGVLAVACALAETSADAATLYVPSQYPTIHAAMDVCAPGDTVLVASGTYSDVETRHTDGGWGYPIWVTSCCYFANGAILRSESGPQSTTIDMQGQSGGAVSYVVLIGGKPSMTMAIEGLTITGVPQGFPAIRLLENGKVTVRDCIFRDIQGNPYGGAINSSGTQLDLLGCTFRENTGGPVVDHMEYHFLAEDCLFENNEGGHALALDGYQSWTALVTRCRFVGNVSPSAPGVAASSWYKLTIEDCVFENNTTTVNSGAVRISGDEGGNRTVVRRNVFLNNAAEWPASGAGVFWGESGGLLEQNTFYGNRVIGTPPGALNGASFVCSVLQQFTLTMTGNVFAGSSGGYAVRDHRSQTDPLSSCNVYWDNAGGDYSGFAPDSTDLFVDPLLCGPENGDLRVSEGSVCLPPFNACGIQIGAFGAGCGTVSVESASWGAIKALYR